MITRRSLALAPLAAMALAAPALAQSRTKVRFSLNLPRNGSNLAFLFGRDRGYFADEGIEITDMDPASGSDALTRVASGAYDASFAGTTGLPDLVSRAPDAAPLSVFNVFRVTPASVVTWSKDKLNKPADLVGKTLGGPITDNGYRLLPVFFKVNGLDPASVKFNNMDLRMREPAFIRREVDGVTGFDSTIWLNLKLLGVKREDISIMSYAAHGLDIYGNGILVSRKFLRENEAAIPPLLRAVAKSWRETAKDPKAAAAVLTKIDPIIRADIEEKRFRWVLEHQVMTPETAATGIGPVDVVRLQKGLDLQVEGFGLPAKIPVSRIWSDKYLPSLDQRKMA